MNSEIENEVLTELKHAAKPLVELGLYGSTREFIRDVTLEFIKHKIEFYKNQLKVFEKKNTVCPLVPFQRSWKKAHPSRKRTIGWIGKLPRTC